MLDVKRKRGPFYSAPDMQMSGYIKVYFVMTDKKPRTGCIQIIRVTS